MKQKKTCYKGLQSTKWTPYLKVSCVDLSKAYKRREIRYHWHIMNPKGGIPDSPYPRYQLTPRIIFRNEPTFTYRRQPKLRFGGWSYRSKLITLIPMLSKG